MTTTWLERWRRLLDRFVPAALREDVESLRRARLVAGYALAVTVWGPVFALVYVLTEVPQAVWILGPAVALALGTLVILSRSGRVGLAGNWLTFLLFATLATLGAVTGGHGAPALDWSVAVPLVALALAGPRSGAVWFALVMAQYATFYYLAAVTGVAMPNALDPDDLSLVKLLGSCSLATLLSLMAWIHGEQTIAALLEANRRLRDETSRHHETRDRLRHAEKMEALGRLVAGVGHEINNPLGYVIGNLELLEQGLDELKAERFTADGANLQELARDVRLGADRIRDIVRSVDVFARERPREVGPLDPIPIVEQSLRLAENEIRHRARLVRDLDHVPAVAADACGLSQILVNLLVNAAQSIPLGQIDDHEIRVTMRADDDQVVIEIADSGAGIPEAQLAHIFEPFYTTRRGSGGSGLGLAITHELVTRFGGSIEVHSELGRGTRFSVRLPAAEEAPPEAPPKPRLAPVAGARARVLVVDDDPALRRTLRRLLRDHDVTLAASGSAGLAACRTGDWDVVLCDLMMPDLTGIEVFEQACAHRPELEDRFLFITGGALSEEAARFCHRMKSRVLQKPFDAETLLARITPRER